MKYSKRSDIVILLASLLILSFSIGILYAQDAPQGQKFATDTQIMNVLSPSLAARNISQVGNLIAHSPLEQQIRLLDTLIKNNTIAFNRSDKLKLVFYIALANPASARALVFNELLQNPALIKEPVLYQAAISGYQSVIPELLEWLQKNPERKKLWQTQALQYAIYVDKPAAFKRLLENGVRVLPAAATDLMWQAIAHNRNPEFTLLLVKKGAHINDARKGITFLGAATKNNNSGTVQILLESGADANLFKDPTIGTPLQIAFRNGFTQVELLLRKWGASERAK